MVAWLAVRLPQIRNSQFAIRNPQSPMASSAHFFNSILGPLDYYRSPMANADDRAVRILLFDEETLVRAALRKLLESWNGIEVVSECGNTEEAVDGIQRSDPDLVLATMTSDNEEDFEMVGDLVRASERAKVLVLTGETSQEAVIGVVRLGARGVVFKKRAAAELRKAIQKVHEGELWLDRLSLAMLVTEATRPDPSRGGKGQSRFGLLTGREREVTALVTKGYKNKEIGERLFISETTVRHHLTTIFKKLNVSSRFELITYLHRHRVSAPSKPEPPSETAARKGAGRG